MKLLAALLFAVVSTTVHADNFNYESYSRTTLSHIVNSWNSTTEDSEPGYSAREPEKLRLTVTSLTSPFICGTEPLLWAIRLQGAENFLERSPSNHCIKIRENVSTKEFIVYIQDVLVQSYVDEVKAGSSVTLYTVLLAYVVKETKLDNYPVILVNEFKAP